MSKKILVVGMARSGLAAVKYLAKKGYSVVVNDSKPEEELGQVLDELKAYQGLEYVLGKNPSGEVLRQVDLALVSPGVPLELDFLVKLREMGKEVISEVELAYREGQEKNIKFIGITGTNGKTTTTSIVGEICKEAGLDTYVVGNIGNPAISAVEEAQPGAVLVIELSSFQLEAVYDFRPEVSTVLNLTEDHMNRHHTMENYAKAKANIFAKQTPESVCVLNYDDPITRDMGNTCQARPVYFSRQSRPEAGIYLDDNKNIIAVKDGREVEIVNAEDLSLPGGHNLENSMAAIGLCLHFGIDKEIIKKVLTTFKAVEHRLEYVNTVNGVVYVNDSKGTNPDSTIKAVQSYKTPIILIAGGYDKGSDFTELFDIAVNYVRAVLVIGQTADLIADTAFKAGIKEIYKLDSLKEAVIKASQIADKDDVVLLSPACASWGMYKNYEERGQEFKDIVNNIL
ncbi:UDP-N-acetylmuramoyl-L-alanine--D-glutamate ligase [Peptostreptococcus stomatis]|uniref:UDP-N-acetylmuramoyl-L-alanine--D-glutamate ligase n=1 Tax=Peptostreptococcus stomatis TaxID=341694 RepID=UPI003F9EDBBE